MKKNNKNDGICENIQTKCVMDQSHKIGNAFGKEVVDISRKKVFRRSFLKKAVCSLALGVPMLSRSIQAKEESLSRFRLGDTFALDENNVRFYSRQIKEPMKIMILADTHLFMDDQRGEPFTSFSCRMAKAYNHTKHYLTKASTDPSTSFVKSLEYAKNSKKYDAVTLLGDIVSFPSEAGIEWASQKLKESGLPWYYISGNHDWHYEGMPGTEKDLRAEWTKKRLSPLYQGNNPLGYAVDVKGIRLVMLDDSIYEILPEQLAFFKKQVAEGVPMILMMHIPMYAPGRSVGFGCGHPEWSETTDKNWKVERRPHWPVNGHSAVTMEFYKTVFNAPNLLGIFAGHVHRQYLDVINGKPQFVVPTNSNQGFMTAEFIPVK